MTQFVIIMSHTRVLLILLFGIYSTTKSSRLCFLRMLVSNKQFMKPYRMFGDENGLVIIVEGKCEFRRLGLGLN